MIQVYVDGDLLVDLDMGSGSPTITSGLGGYAEVTRPNDISITEWVSPTPIKQDIPIMFDGFAERQSVQEDVDKVFSLARNPGGTPSPFTLYGPIQYSGMEYVIESITDNGSERQEGTGILIRQELVLHIMEHVASDSIGIFGSPGGGGGGAGGKGANDPKKYTVKDSDTLKKIAVKVYKKTSAWKAIGQLNNIRDPNKKLKKGTKLNMPKKSDV